MYKVLTQGYRSAVQWIAGNDDEELGNDDTGYILTVCMVADLWGKEQAQVAADVLKLRGKED